MEWIVNNWMLLLIAALCIGMFFFGKGCCAHGKDECDEHKPNDEAKDEKKGHGCCQ
jgi:hypothetical protein